MKEFNFSRGSEREESIDFIAGSSYLCSAQVGFAAQKLRIYVLLTIQFRKHLGMSNTSC